MELLTQNLPSGKHYDFPSVRIMPLTFSQILSYLENSSKNPIEKFMLDYSIVKMDDKNVEELLLTDLEYVVFIKKGLTIAENLEFTTQVTCPDCKNEFSYKFSAANLKFNKYDDQLLIGMSVELGGKLCEVRMPTVREFMTVLTNYRRVKSKIDLRLIKLISLLSESLIYPQVAEKRILNATYTDITVITMLDQLYFNTVSPLKVTCDQCHKERGMEIGIENLISNLFRDVIQNNGLAQTKIISREVR